MLLKKVAKKNWRLSLNLNPDWMYRCDPTSFRKLELEVEELRDMIATLEQENRQLHARNQRLEQELGQEYLGCIKHDNDNP